MGPLVRPHARKLRLKSKNPGIDTEALSPYGTECFFMLQRREKAVFRKKFSTKCKTKATDFCKICRKHGINLAKISRKSQDTARI